LAGRRSPQSLPSVVAIFGPTASGKSAVAAALLERVSGEVVSADSAAIYRGLSILTAAPDYPARLVGIVPLSHEVSVGEFQRLAHTAIDEIVASGRTAFVVGGTGLYLRAALSSMQLPPPPEPGARERWDRAYEQDGAEAAHALLAASDPAAAARVHPNDRRRVVRALELAEAGSSLRPERGALWAPETRHPSLVVGLDVPLELLDRRIEERTAAMFERGVVEEVRAAVAGPLSTTASQVIGLRTVSELPEPAAREQLARDTRRLARYQRKWMRRISGLVMVAADRTPDEVADAILEVGRAGERLPARGAG
jgi:tRNA dimethylallyltransferase